MALRANPMIVVQKVREADVPGLNYFAFFAEQARKTMPLRSSFYDRFVAPLLPGRNLSLVGILSAD